jgi:glycosyltransferase involved in cell wall biosynthesis
MANISLGVKVFSRSDKLEDLLDSVAKTAIKKVYVADDGKPTNEKQTIYRRNYPFDLTVLDLEFDAGLGYGRNQIVETADDEYLLIVDSDHKIPPTVTRLADQLDARPDLGGVAGLLFECGKVRGTVHDLYEHGGLLVRDARKEKTVERIAGDPFVAFDFIPNAVMFRREALVEQGWDPQYIIGKEHLDFYVAHQHNTDWTFGINPTVLFDHTPGGGDMYVADRESAAKLERSRNYFFDKWGYRQLLLGQTDWYDITRRARDPSRLAKQAVKALLLSLPPNAQVSLMDARDWLRRLWNRPPL